MCVLWWLILTAPTSSSAAAGKAPNPSAPTSSSAANPKVELGRQLFFDERLSTDGTRSCYSCHKNEDGTGGHDPLAIGAKQKPLTRHSPTLWNIARFPRFYWDGRAGTLEAQAKAAWAGANMGVGPDGLEGKAKEIGAIEGYKRQFELAYPGQAISAEVIVSALAEFERTLSCNDTAFDRFVAGDKKALNAEQKRGLELFEGKAACNACHAPPSFSVAMDSPEGAYFNVGVGVAGKPEADVDSGRMNVTKLVEDWAAFKVPSLRNVRKSGPYFHDGSATTLEAAVRFMASGGAPNKNLTPLLKNRGLNDQEIAALVAFLKALDCPGTIVAPKQKF